jgi:hypothetical protein
VVDRRTLIVCGVIAPLARVARSEESSSILTRAMQRYYALKSYQDRGAVRYRVMGSEQRVDFQTAFTRPSAFRFEWSKGHSFPPLRHLVTRSVIWTKGDTAYTWTKYPDKEPTEREDGPLSLAVAAATGVSSGSAHVIATMLIADLWRREPFGDSVLNAKGVQLLGLERLDGAECYRLRGVDWRDDPIDLWLGREDLLMRRNERVIAGTKYIEERTGIIVNADIPASRFASPGRTGA